MKGGKISQNYFEVQFQLKGVRIMILYKKLIYKALVCKLLSENSNYIKQDDETLNNRFKINKIPKWI